MDLILLAGFTIIDWLVVLGVKGVCEFVHKQNHK